VRTGILGAQIAISLVDKKNDIMSKKYNPGPSLILTMNVASLPAIHGKVAFSNWICSASTDLLFFGAYFSFRTPKAWRVFE
jgi:hypothetical protein